MKEITNVNNGDNKTKIFNVPTKKDVIESAQINGDWGDIVVQYQNGKEINYTEESEISPEAHMVRKQAA